ncbi:hypothetical protein [Actinomadura sp. DC4]|uniref:hypothetical protein n=1 Tax=Actinomadura sp. DC4 TaxID=3055069 RepID=UPI0025B1D49E|nr:hypothetical protein [Actinomadura sp. DC4]MDN3353021.1 hypothetical protein [Actinomadura sp. DC4]
MSDASAGWRGTGHEAHLFLSPEDDEAVRAAHAQAAEAGGSLNAKLEGLKAASTPYGGELEGLENSVKGLDSLRRKVASDVSEGADASDVIAETRDMNRYTICFPSESYSDGVAAGFDHLKAQGLKPYKPEETHKNTWNNPPYKGINTTWTDQDTGQFVEIQFHTPESFQAKSDNHALYELSRSGSLEADEELAADWLQAQRYEGVEVPQGHDSTVPARPPRELATSTPEALEAVRAKEAELKQSQANDATQDEPESHSSGSAEADEVASPESAQGATDERPETGESEDDFPQPVDEDAAEPREADAAPEEQGPGEYDEAEGADHSPDAEGAQGAQGQDAGASYDDHEDHQLARIAAAADEQQEGGDRDDYGDTSAAAENRERGGAGD